MAAVVVVDAAVWTSLPTIPRAPAPASDAPSSPVDPPVTVTIALRRSRHIGIEIRPRTRTSHIDINPSISRRGRVIHLHAELMLVVVSTVPVSTPPLTVVTDTMSHEELPIIDDPSV